MFIQSEPRTRPQREPRMSIHPANLLADWHFDECLRRGDHDRVYEAAGEETAPPLDRLREEQPWPTSRRYFGRIRIRLRGVVGSLARAATRLPQS